MLLAVLLPGSVAAAVPAIDYELDLQLRPDRQRIEGLAVLTGRESGIVPPLALAASATVAGVAVDGQAVPFTFANGRLRWQAGGSAPARQVTIRYQALFDDPLPADTIGVEDPSFGVNATIGPAGSYLGEGVAWFPRAADRPGHHRLRLTAPAGVLAVTAGRLVATVTRDGTSISEWHSTTPLAGLALAAGPYQLAAEELDGIQLLTFLSADNAALAPGYLAAMRRHLALYRDLLGPYPYAKFAVVENFLPTGYGLPSWTLLGKSVVRLPFILDTSLPHEIVHSWWGNAVAVDYARGNWAEGLTTYLADYLLKERTAPWEALDYRRKLLRDYAALVTTQNDFPLSSFSGRMARYQQAIGYGKGAMVFHMLRRQVGDEVFFGALRRLAVEGNGRMLGWDDFERVFAGMAGEDLRWFFRQWVEQPGAPRLLFDEVRVTRADGGWTVRGAVRQDGPVFRLDLPVRITTVDGGSTAVTMAVNGARTPFAVTVPEPPQRLEGDPDSDLFRRLAPVELPATVNDLASPRRPLVVVADGQRQLLAAAQALLKGLHWETAPVIAEADLAVQPRDGRDLLLLGWPRRADLRSPLPAGLEIGADGAATWRSDGRAIAAGSLFAVLAGGEGAGRVAVFSADSSRAARASGAKIAHYGRYSLLLFDADGRNLAKTTWEPASSPLRVEFSPEKLP